VAHEIARLFLGGLVPHRLLGPGLARLVEHLPVPFQVVHSDDVAEAFVEAVLVGAQGAFNVAAEPPLGSGPAPGWLEPVGHRLAAAAWRLHAIETNPGWVDLALRAPLMDTTRARTELGWRPRHDAHETLRELLAGFRDDATFATPPLAE
jgi:nucleoside-diphosphate-sugar epimerase